MVEYLASEYQALKDQRKLQTDSRQESNAEEKAAKKTKKREVGSNQPQKVMYRLYRSDNLGNANEVSTAEYE